MLNHTARLSLLLALVLPACAVDNTSTATRAIIDTPCAEDTDCPSGFECEVEDTTSFCQAEDEGGDCPAGYELEVEHGQAFCKPHGGDDGADDTSGGGTDDSVARMVTAAPSATDAPLVVTDTTAKAVDVAGTASCTPGVKAKIKAGPRDPGAIKTNVQIDDVAVGIAWRIRVIDGTEAVVRTRTTAGASGSINLDTFTADNAGADKVRFRAVRIDGSAICTGVVTVP